MVYPKHSVEGLYRKLTALKYGALTLALALIFGSVLLLEYSSVPFGVALACFITGALGAPVAIALPQYFWRCPACKGYLKNGRNGKILKPEANCPHCGAQFE